MAQQIDRFTNDQESELMQAAEHLLTETEAGSGPSYAP